MSIKKILFVCTGNSCRSVMAEAFFKKLLKESNLSYKNDIIVASAGTGCISGRNSTTNTIQVLSAEGMDAADHLSQPITEELIKESDWIFVMEKGHKDRVLSMSPYAAHKIYLLTEYRLNYPSDGKTYLGIDDPIGNTQEFYRHCLDIIKINVERIFTELFPED